LVWGGNAVAWPTYLQEIRWEWTVDPINQQYVPQLAQADPELHLEVWNPLHFYVDPTYRNRYDSRWGYFSQKRRQELVDCPYVINKDKLESLGSVNAKQTQPSEGLSLTAFDKVQDTYNNNEHTIKYDVFYFPYLKTAESEYRNMWVAVAEEQLLVEFRPNFTQGAQNPAIYCDWLPDKDSPYGTGPMEDIAELQRLINILQNYVVETFARIGNKFVIKEGVDLTNFWGQVAGVMVAESPSTDVLPITGNFVELEHLLNYIGTLKAEAQVVAGSQDPFQGASNIDFKKTATEIQLLQENSISIIREIIEHISAIGIQRILERLMMIAADIYHEPMTFRVEEQFITVHLSLLKQMKFSMELTSVNASQSKQAQVESLMQLMQMDPMMIPIFQPVLEKIGMLEGMKDTPEILTEITQKIMGMQVANAQQQQALAQQQGVSGPGASQPAHLQPGMAQAPQAAA
jgi:hypothetical protein